MLQTAQDDISPWAVAADALKRDGIVAAPELFAAEADYLREAFITLSRDPLVDPKLCVVPVSAERGARVGNPVWSYISLTDPVLAGLLLRPDLLGLIGHYYGSQPYFRRMPFVKRTSVAPHHESDISAVYHIDQGKHFVSIMMLLSDLTEQQSHMRFLAGTHLAEQRDFRLKPTDPANRELDYMLETKYSVVPLVGPKGTMFIYDNGNGIHKGNMIAGTTRDVMQATFSRGDHESKPADRELLPDALRASVGAAEPVVREALKFIA